MASWAFALLLLPMIFHGCFANDEGDILLEFKQTLHDPTSATSSWSSSLQNPCTWDHIVCSNDYYVIRIELGSQQLSGSLVSSLGKLSHLEYLELYNNNITGNVPDELGNLSGLISLDLYQNSLTSTIPDSLGRLGKLRYLRLNNNSLHGEIPISLTKISNLQVLDLSNNNLSGSVPSNGSFSRFTPLSFSNNNGLCGEAIGVQCPGQPPLSSPTPPTQNSEDVSSSLPIKAIIAAVVVSAVLVVTGGAVAYYLWRRKSPEDYFDVAYDEEDPKVNLGQLRRFTLRELQLATGNFDNENIIGRGGFGKVYKGQLPDGSIVAVKRLKEEVTESSELQFQMELEIISLAVHRNLLRLTGFCMSVTERLLVYPYMANGSVSSQLREHRERKALTWEIRKRIALGAARGLAYLHEHCDPKIIHRDVKAANILLDDTFEPLVGDFGLAKVIDLKKTHVISAVRGTLGHIAPEYLSTGKTSEKSDVFGYGITLLELVSGQRAYDLARLADDEDIMLLQWVKKLLFAGKINEFVDPALLEMEANLVEIEEMVQMALLCTRASADDRPKMKDVVRMQERQEMVSQLWREYQGDEEEVKSLPSSSSMWSNTSSNVIAIDLSGPR